MKRLAFILTLFICVLFMTAPVPGAVVPAEKTAETTTQQPPLRVRILDHFVTEPNDEGALFLLFTEADIADGYTGDIVVLFGTVRLAGALSGTVYTLSSAVSCREDGVPPAEPLLSLLSFLGTTSRTDGMVTYADVIPRYALLLFWLVAETLICMMLYPIKPGFMEQNGVLLFEEPVNVLRNGLTTYFFLLALIVIFSLSVILLPAALLIFLAAQALLWLGEVALAVTAGRLLASRLLKRAYHNGYMVLALLTIGALKCIPTFSLPFTFFFLPILSLGLVMTGFINGWIHKKYYSTPFHDNPSKKAIDISVIRGIIMNDNSSL